MTPRRLHLHGPGRAGTSLVRILASHGWPVSGLSGGGEEGAEHAAVVLGGGVTHHGPDVPTLDAGSVLVLGVPDDVLVAAAAAVDPVCLPPGTMVLHLSGLHGLDVFPAGWPESVGRGAFHPLRSFPTRDPGEGDLDGCLVALEAARSEDRPFLGAMAEAAGGRPFFLEARGRAAYHLGASLMGNATFALLHMARNAFREAGVPDAQGLDGLLNLTKRALDNAHALGIPSALTGPVVRGDVGVLDRHLEQVGHIAPEQRGLYLNLVRAQLDAAGAQVHETTRARVVRWLAEHER